jgi:hypothetical protein
VFITQGKSASCTADESLGSELETLRSSVPSTLQAIITFGKHSIQTFFSPENALADFRKKVKEVWNIPSKIYYLFINGAHESRIPEVWSMTTVIQVKAKGLLGGGRKGALTLVIEGEECRCYTNQTFREAFEDRDLEIKANQLISVENGAPIGIEELIGEYFGAGSTDELDWDIEEEDDQESYDPRDPYKDWIKLSYCLDEEWRQIVVGRERTMRSFVSDNWDDFEWAEFRHQGKRFDPDALLLDHADEKLNISIVILTQEDLDRENEYEEDQAQWKALEEEETSEDQEDFTSQDDRRLRGDMLQTARSRSGFLDGHQGQSDNRDDDSHQIGEEERSIETISRGGRPMDDGSVNQRQVGEATGFGETSWDLGEKLQGILDHLGNCRDMNLTWRAVELLRCWKRLQKGKNYRAPVIEEMEQAMWNEDLEDKEYPWGS